jgi:hypothetical protein
MLAQLLRKLTKRRDVPALGGADSLSPAVVSAVAPSTPGTAEAGPKSSGERPNWFAKERYDGTRCWRLGPHSLSNVDISGLPTLSIPEWAESIASEPTEIHRTVANVRELGNIESVWNETVDRVHGPAADGKRDIFGEYVDVRCAKCFGHTFVSFLRNIRHFKELERRLSSGNEQCGSIARDFPDRLPIYGANSQCDSVDFQIIWKGDTANSAARHLILERLDPPEGSIFVMVLEPGLFGACRVIRKGNAASAPTWDRMGVTIDGLLVMATAWIGSNPPSLSTDEKELRKPLRKTFGEWGDSLEVSWVNKRKLPSDFTFAGILPVTSDERQLDSREANAWEWIATQVLNQVQFDRAN